MGTNEQRGESKKKRKKMGPVRWIIFVICMGVFLVSAGMLLNNYLEGKKAQDDFSSLVVSGTYDLAELQKQNEDIVGWLQIPDTKINYPVMQTKNSPEYYLRRNFKKEHSIAGTPFMDAASDVDLPTLNWTVYGHNMKNGIMFHDLLQYEEEDFYKEHKTLTFDTINDEGEIKEGSYVVVAAFYTQIYTSDYQGFKYYKYNDITTPSTLLSYVSECKKLATYDTGVEVEGEDQILTLSTCAYHVDEGRFVVIAKKVE